MGGVTKSFAAIEEFGRRVTETKTRISQSLDPMRNIPVAGLLFPPRAVFPAHSLNQAPEANVLVTAKLKTKLAASLPRKARWHHVDSHFVDKDTLSVTYQGTYIGRYDYAALGFGRKNMGIPKSDVQWELLYKLAMLSSYEYGKMAEPTAAVLAEMLEVSEVTLFKRMSRLSQKLQEAFGIKDTPFLDYLPTKGYRAQFGLRSEALLRGQGQLRPSGSQILEKHTPDNTDENDWD